MGWAMCFFCRLPAISDWTIGHWSSIWIFRQLVAFARLLGNMLCQWLCFSVYECTIFDLIWYAWHHQYQAEAPQCIMNPFGDLENYVGSQKVDRVDPLPVDCPDCFCFYCLRSWIPLFPTCFHSASRCAAKFHHWPQNHTGSSAIRPRQHFPNSCCFPTVWQEGMMIPQLVMLLGG